MRRCRRSCLLIISKTPACLASRNFNSFLKEARMSDPTESFRRQRVAEINAEPGSRPALEAQFGQVWDTADLARDFVVTGFMAPYVVVRRKSDGVRGSLEFQHQPRFYFNFQPE
jgi:hypothetical protein